MFIQNEVLRMFEGTSATYKSSLEGFLAVVALLSLTHCHFVYTLGMNSVPECFKR